MPGNDGRGVPRECLPRRRRGLIHGPPRRRTMASDHALTRAGDGPAKKEDAPAAGGKATPPPPRPSFLIRCVSLLGLASLCYLLGAAVMFFDLPTSSLLRHGFVGGAAWYEA